MKRSGFKRKLPPKYQPKAEREPRPMATFEHAKSLHKAVMAGGTSGKAVGKDNPVRSEAYRRLVAQLPCWLCRIPGYSQAAHADEGKGLGMKSDDRTCYPLCGPRPGTQGCHYEVGTGGKYSKEARRRLERWAGKDTREAIEAAGLWPRNLPKWGES